MQEAVQSVISRLDTSLSPSQLRPVTAEDPIDAPIAVKDELAEVAKLALGLRAREQRDRFAAAVLAPVFPCELWAMLSKMMRGVCLLQEMAS